VRERAAPRGGHPGAAQHTGTGGRCQARRDPRRCQSAKRPLGTPVAPVRRFPAVRVEAMHHDRSQLKPPAAGWRCWMGAAFRRCREPALVAGLRRGLRRGLERGGPRAAASPHWYSAKRFSAPIRSAYSAISRPLPPIRDGRIGWTGLSPSGTPITAEEPMVCRLTAGASRIRTHGARRDGQVFEQIRLNAARRRSRIFTTARALPR